MFFWMSVKFAVETRDDRRGMFLQADPLHDRRRRISHREMSLTMCRHIHAAPYVAWIVVPVARFSYSSEMPRKLESSADGTRYFCAACGTHVACVNASHPEIIDVAVGSLDRPEAFTPTMEVFTDTRLGWVPAIR